MITLSASWENVPYRTFELLHIAKPSVLRTLPDGEHAVKEIVEPFASGKVVGSDGTVQRAFGCMCQNKDGQSVSLFEVVELYHQPSCRIAFLHGAAQVGKIVNDEDFAPGLQSHLFYASHDGFLEIGFQQRIAVKRYPVQPFRKDVWRPCSLV